jgi:hypothetical protein
LSDVLCLVTGTQNPSGDPDDPGELGAVDPFKVISDRDLHQLHRLIRSTRSRAPGEWLGSDTGRVIRHHR